MAFRQEPTENIEPIPSVDGGVKTRQRAWNLEVNQAADMLNVDISEFGKWAPRLGAKPEGGWQAEPGGITYFKEDARNVYAWAIFGSRLTRNTGNGTWEVKASNVSCYAGLLHQFVGGIYNDSNFADNQYRAIYGCQCIEQSGTTESTRLFVFKGDNVTADAQATQHASYAPLVITYFQNRLWKANDQVSGDGSDLAWSELDDGLTYSPANELSVEAGIGGPIKALIPGRGVNPQLYIFKESAIARLEPKWGSSSSLIPTLGDELDTISSKLDLLSPSIGCVATKSCIWVPGPEGDDVMFLARDGVRRLSRATDDTLTGAGPPVSFDIPDWIDRINFDHADKAVAAFFDDAYHLAVPMDGETQNSHVLRYNMLTGSWSLHDWEARDAQNIPFNNESRYYFQNNFQTIDCSYTGAPASEYQVYQGYSGDADPGGDPIWYFLETRALVFQNPDVEKKWDRLLFLGTTGVAETHAMRIAYRVDFQNWVTAASTVLFGVPGNVIIMGETPLSWVQPDQKLIQRRFDLKDAVTGTMLQIRFMSGLDDYARPEIYYADVTAQDMQEIFDNSR